MGVFKTIQWRDWFCSVPIMMAELIFFLYKTGESMLDATIRPYIIRVVCHTKFPSNDSICKNLDSFPELEDDVQAEAGSYLIYYRMLVNIPAILLGLFCGAWSDKYGRKIPMMLPSLGSVFSVLLYMLSLASPDHAIALTLTGALVQGAFGKSSVITMAVNSYASDITDKDDRSRKLGKLLAMNFFGLFFGALLAGIFQDNSDQPATFCTVVFFHAVVVLISLICMPETVPFAVERPEPDMSKEKKNLFLIGNMKDSLNVLVKRRVKNGRKIILILFLVSLINQTCKVGETDITLLFVTHSPLSWPKSWYGYLLSLDYAIMGICLIIVLPILSSFLHLSDGAIVIIGLACKIIRLFWAAFIQESWMVYVSVVIGSFAGMITSSIRSLMSKSVEENEMGKVFSLLATAETASKLLGTVIFVSLYGATAYFFPGFAFITEAILYMIMLLIIILIYKDLKQVGTYDLMSTFTEHQFYSEKQTLIPPKQLTIVDELEEDPLRPAPLPANTP